MANRTVPVAVLFAASLLFFSLPAFAQQPCPLQAGKVGDAEIWLEGTVGNLQVRAYLSGDPDHNLEGGFYDLKSWTPVSLTGTLSGNCDFHLMEAHGSKPDGSGPTGADGFWDGRLGNPATLEGTRQNPSPGEAGPILLRRIVPMNCDGKGNWIRMTRPGFPVSFEYPEGWRIDESPEKDLRVVCPDPRVMQYDDVGVLIQSMDAANNSNESGRFTRYQGTWWFAGTESGGSCDPPGVLCARARVSNLGGVTVLYGRGSTRLYAVGKSYQGQTEEEDYLLLLPNHWVNISSVMVGESVTNRIARTIRPTAVAPR